MSRAPRARWIVLTLAPLLIAAADPAGDVAPCPGETGSGDAPDLVEARGEIVELGTSTRWTLTFAEPLRVPDAHGRPFRVDVAIRDRDVPAVSFAYYRGVNRLVRVDATIDHRTEILLIPEQAQNVFNPPVLDGRTMTIQVPGRILSDDEDLTGTSPGLAALRWTVIVRDEGSCDLLGEGRPTERLVVATDAAPSPSPAPRPERASSAWWLAAGGAAVLVVGVGAYVLRRAR